MLDISQGRSWLETLSPVLPIDSKTCTLRLPEISSSVHFTSHSLDQMMMLVTVTWRYSTLWNLTHNKEHQTVTVNNTQIKRRRLRWWSTTRRTFERFFHLPTRPFTIRPKARPCKCQWETYPHARGNMWLRSRLSAHTTTTTTWLRQPKSFTHVGGELKKSKSLSHHENFCEEERSSWHSKSSPANTKKK